MSIICRRCHKTKPISGWVPPCDNPEHPVRGAQACEWAPGLDLSASSTVDPAAIEAAAVRAAAAYCDVHFDVAWTQWHSKEPRPGSAAAKFQARMRRIARAVLGVES